MGIKSLNLHMILHLMTNHLSCVQVRSMEDQPLRTIKLIKSDGLVKIYHHPIHVSEVLNEFPKHLVCDSDSFFIGQKIPPLSETERLQLGHNYFLLPKQFFQSVLSFVTLTSFAAINTRPKTPPENLLLKKAATCGQAFVIQKTPSGSLQIRVSDEFISNLMQEDKISVNDGKEEEPRSRICTSAQLQKDYTQLVLLSRQWKPKLEEIAECKRKKRLVSFGIKKKKSKTEKKITENKSEKKSGKKLENKKIQKTEHVQVSSSSSSKNKSSGKTKKIKGKKGGLSL